MTARTLRPVLVSITAAMCCYGAHAEAAPGATLSWYEEQSVGAQPESGNGSIKTDSSGNVVLTSKDAETVTKFSPTGGVLASYTVINLDQSGRLLIDSSQNIYIDGTAADSSRSYLAVTKLNSSLHPMWTKKFDLGPVNEHMAGGPMVMGANGTLYVIGRAGNSSQGTGALTAFQIDSNGNAIQHRDLGLSPDQNPQLANSVLAVDPSGLVYFGDGRGIRKLSANLQVDQWTTARPLVVRALAFDRGHVYATGTGMSGTGWYMHVTSLNPATGANVWQHKFNVTPKSSPYGKGNSDNAFGGNAITVDSAGNVYTVGAGAFSDGFSGGTVAKLSASGSVSWAREIGWSGSDGTCADLVLDSSANVYTACTDQQLGNGTSTAISVIYDQAGNEKLYLENDGPGGQDDIFDHVLLGPPGNLYLLDEADAWATDNSGTKWHEPWIFHYIVTGL